MVTKTIEVSREIFNQLNNHNKSITPTLPSATNRIKIYTTIDQLELTLMRTYHKQ